MTLSHWAPLRHQIYVLTGDPTLTKTHFYLPPAPSLSFPDCRIAGRGTYKNKQPLCSLLWVLRKIWDGIPSVGISRYRIAGACLDWAWLFSPAWQEVGQATPDRAESWFQSVCHIFSAKMWARFNRNKGKGIDNCNTKTPVIYLLA